MRCERLILGAVGNRWCFSLVNGLGLMVFFSGFVLAILLVVSDGDLSRSGRLRLA